MKKYIEIEEIRENDFEPPGLFRCYIDTDSEAESTYIANKDLFPNHKAKLVEMNHAADPKDNKPCKSFKIKDGKVIR